MGISFKLRRGETLGIVGESGCGKSTAGRTILRLHDITDGKVIFKGEDLAKCSKKEMRAKRLQMQMVFQDPYASLNPRMTVGNIIGEALLDHKLMSKAEAREKVLETMEICGLPTYYINRYPHEFSGGQRQRIGIARARVELAKKALTAGENKEAISLLEECLEYPHHLGEGKLYGAQENDFYYFLGCAYEGLGRHDKAVECWEQAIIGPTEPAAAMYYNDAKPDKIFYQGLALLKLGRMDEANGRFHKLTSYGEKHLFDKIKMDYFAVSLPDLLSAVE